MHYSYGKFYTLANMDLNFSDPLKNAYFVGSTVQNSKIFNYSVLIEQEKLPHSRGWFRAAARGRIMSVCRPTAWVRAEISQQISCGLTRIYVQEFPRLLFSCHQQVSVVALPVKTLMTGWNGVILDGVLHWKFSSQYEDPKIKVNNKEIWSIH